MKHKVLTATAHNIADSLASGIGLMIGVYDMDVFGEAKRSEAGFIEVDFLTGSTCGAQPSRKLAKAISLYAQALPSLCVRDGVTVSDFQELTARYSARPHCSVVVRVRDANGKTSVDRYVGSPLQRPRVLDKLGRVRRLRTS